MDDSTITTAELADLLYPPQMERRDLSPDQARARHRSRLTSAAKQARRWGLQPVSGRADDGQRLWPEGAVREALGGAPGRGYWGTRSGDVEGCTSPDTQA